MFLNVPLCALLVFECGINSTALEEPNMISWSGQQQTELEQAKDLKRCVVIRSASQWERFCKTAQWQAAHPYPRFEPSQVDFTSHRVLVVRNTKFLNQMRLVSLELTPLQDELFVKIRETRTARPIVDECFFIAIEIPKSVQIIWEGGAEYQLAQPAG